MEPIFHPFPLLPYELRAHIWLLTVQPRTVRISLWIGGKQTDVQPPYYKCKCRFGKREFCNTCSTKRAATLPAVPYAASPLKPGILDACRESRSLALQQNLYEKLILCPEMGGASYAWVNFGVDTIDIGEFAEYTEFDKCAHKIRRLKFKADVGDEVWCYRRCSELASFENLVECFIVTNDTCLEWGGSKPWRPPCDPERTFIIQEQTGETQTLADMDRLWTEMDRQNMRDEGWPEDEIERWTALYAE